MGHSPTAEHDLLSRLGLSDGASEDDVETAHNDVVAFLETAPSELRDWALSQVAAADEAYALLCDRGAAISERPAPARVAPPAPVVQAATTRRAKGRAMQATVEQPRPPFLRRIGPLGRIAIAVTALAGVLIGGYAVYASDLPSVPGLSGTPAPDGQQPKLDTARVAELMRTIQANPNDVSALQDLADLYFSARDYGVAAEWEQKILDIDAGNVTAHLALGAAQYNLGNSADAESHWRRVIELSPNDVDTLVEAHYDLGFMFFSANPPDVDKTIAEWQQVIDLAPDSEIAQTVSTHLETLQQWNASGSPRASGSPAASPSPAASGSPAASPTPAPSPRPSSSAGQ
jgi:cytochrome c-type biogenesis protein CcmH/NrfG